MNKMVNPFSPKEKMVYGLGFRIEPKNSKDIYKRKPKNELTHNSRLESQNKSKILLSSLPYVYTSST